jgi:hypothetical protein
MRTPSRARFSPIQERTRTILSSDHSGTDPSLCTITSTMVNAFTRGYHDVVARVRSLVYAVRLQAANRNEPPVTASDNDEGGYCSIETHVFSTTSNSNEEDFVDFAHSYNALWLCLFNLGIYYSLAVIGFSFVFEDWPIIDSLYFSTVTFTTVGKKRNPVWYSFINPLHHSLYPFSLKKKKRLR